MIFFMAMDDKTEQPTPKKRRDTRERGEVKKSAELSGSVILLALFTVMKSFSSFIGSKAMQTFLRLYQSTELKPDAFGRDYITNYFTRIIISIILCLSPVLITAVLAGLFINYIQVGFLFTSKTLKPNMGKLNPISGMKRLFSLKAVVEMIKSIVKIVILGLVMYSALKEKVSELPSLITYDAGTSLNFIVEISLDIALRAGLYLLILGVADYLYQWWEFERNLRMTKEEVKEEYKMLEGNPQTKSRIKQKQREIGMRRMMQAVPEADVVVVNPTHYAVALKYSPEKYASPVVVAKGKDNVALKIKEKAKEANVEIVENKEVARALFETTELGMQIPEGMYKAVAEILAHVYKIRNIKR